MSLDLGAVVGRVVLEDVEFQRTYVRVTRQMADLGASAGKSAAGTASLDEGLAAVAASGTRAAAGLSRASKSATEAGAAETKAAGAAARHAQALADVATVTTRYAAASSREQQAALRDAAAQSRLTAAHSEAGSAAALQARETARLATAQASAIGASRSLAAAETESATAGGVLARSMRGAGTGVASVVGMSAKATGALAGVVAGFLGIKAVVGIGNDFRDALNGVQAASGATNQQMKAVSAEAVAMGNDLSIPAATAVDAAQAIEDLVKAGVSLDRAMVAARPALLLASAAQVKTADAARILGDTLDDFHLPAQKAGEVANYLAAGANSAGGGLMDMFDAMKYVGPRARAIGVPVRDVVTAITMLAKSGLQGSLAGTGLAMAFQRLASESPKGAKALKDLGIEAWDAQGRFKGMPYLIGQLHTSMKSMGPDSKRFLKDISDAFGARASNVIAAFSAGGIEHWNRFAATIKNGDVQRYANLMNRGIGAGFRQLGKEATSAGLAIYQRLEPYVNSVVQWLGTNLPRAISTVVSILTPAAHVVGAVFGAAWHALGGILSVAGAALSGIGSVLQSISGPLTAIGVGVLAMWAAFKGAAIARVALFAVGTAMMRLSGAAPRVGQALGGMVSRISGAGIAAAGLGLLVGGLVMEWQKSQQSAHEAADSVAAYTRALEQSNGVVGDAIVKSTQKQLADEGMLDRAKALGISYRTVTEAALGNAKAQGEILKKTGDGIDAGGQLYHVTKMMGDQLGVAKGRFKEETQAAKENTAAKRVLAQITKGNANTLGVSATAYAAAQAAAKQNTDQTNAQTLAFQVENDAASLLQQALDGLAGVNLSVAQAQTAVASANLSVAAAFKQNGNAIRGNSAAAVGNQQAIEGQVSAAQQYAEAVGKQTGSSKKAVAAFRNSKNALEDQLRAQGKLTPAVQKYIEKLYNLSNLHVKPTKLDAETAAAHQKVSALQARINAIRQSKVPGLTADSQQGMTVIAGLQTRLNAIRQGAPPNITLNDAEAYNKLHALQSYISGLQLTAHVHLIVPQGAPAQDYIRGQGPTPTGASAAGSASWTANGKLPPGLSTVGERGWELVSTDSSGRSEVFSHSQSRAMTGGPAVLPGFASGTSKKEHHVVDGVDYPTARAADNARNRNVNAADKDLHALVHLTRQIVTIGKHGAIHGSVQSPGAIMAAIHAWEAAMRKAGMSKAEVAKLKQYDAVIKGAAAERNMWAHRLEAAQGHLLDAQKVKRQDTASFRGAVTGTFDATTAGADANGHVTKGRIIAQERQAVARAHAWLTGIKRLVSLKVFPNTFLRQLAAKGPEALPEVQAYASMSSAQLKSLRNDFTELNKLGQAAGNAVATRLDQPAINKYRREVVRDQAREERVQRELVSEIGHVVGKSMGNFRGLLTIKTGSAGKLSGVIETDRKRGRHNRGGKP